MDKYNLYVISRTMMQKNKGILASDERGSSLYKKLEEIGVEGTEENGRRLREIFIDTPGNEDYISGIILSEETIVQSDSDNIPFTKILQDKGILIGVKVDDGTQPLRDGSEEKITKGLELLKNKLPKYREMGATFTKWRAVIKIGEGIPTEECIKKNCDLLAQYSVVVQEHGMVPIVEPEVLIKGSHGLKKSEEVTTQTLRTLFESLKEYKVDTKAVILKTSMVINGTDNSDEVKPEDIAEATIRTLKNSVPADVPGIVFLSGGQTPVQATQNLDAIAKIERDEPLPWELAFSFLRAIEQPALEIWQGKDENVTKAREAFIERLKMNSLADQGWYADY
jgi:fructose-bisphosphate aldolase class I